MFRLRLLLMLPAMLLIWLVGVTACLLNQPRLERWARHAWREHFDEL